MLLGIFNGVGFSLGDAFSDPNLVLTVLVSQLGGSPEVIGLLPTLRNAGWLLPQMFSAGWVQSLRYKLTAYRLTGLIRWLIWLGMVLVVWNAARWSTSLVLLLFLLMYAAYNLTAGMGALGFQDVVAKTIPAQRRGTFFGLRNFFGGLLGFVLAGPLVGWILARSGPFAFPHNFAVLLLLTLLAITPALIAFAFIDEPPTLDPPTRASTKALLRQIPAVLRRDADLRRYVNSRIVSRLAMLADPFYVLYASEVLHVPPRMIGVYLALRVFSAAFSNLYWARVADRHGNRLLTLLTNAIWMLVPVWALLVAACGIWFAPTVLGWLFGGVFILTGLSIDGAGIAQLSYLMELASEHDRPLYLAVANTLMGVASFFPVIGGVIIGWLGYEALFVLTVAFGLWALWLSYRLREPRTLAAGELAAASA